MNPKGMPTLFLHGGPGAGFSDADKSFFDFKRQNVIFFDQRGAGRSRPFASLRANTTAHIVDDIFHILEHFKIAKVFLFGGSWGSTLALIFAIKYTKRVSGMLLRGIFLGTKESYEQYLGGGVRKYFPQEWDRFISNVPEKFRSNPAKFYLKQMRSRDRRIRKKFAYEWAFYELSLAKLNLPVPEIAKYMKMFSYESLSPIEAHFMTHECFISRNYIRKNLYRLGKIPTSIVQERYDVLTPPEGAFELHTALPKSQLHFVCAGHSATEEGIANKLKQEMNRMLSNRPS